VACGRHVVLAGGVAAAGRARRGRALRFLGRAGSGLSASLATRVATALAAHPVPRSPFDDPVPATARKDARWCEPVVVVQIAYRERTTGGVLRHPVVLGLRDDAVPDAWEQP
jgi:bifunctional non-homologous end joining protein LigD